MPPSAVHFSLSLGDQAWYLVGGAGALYGLFNLVVWLGLLVVLPGLTGGTIGKFVFGIRVVGADARPPGILRSLLREIMWIVDDFPYFIPGLTGFIVALSSKSNQRVGDMVAGTWVIRAGSSFAPPPPPPPPAFAQPQPPPPA
ncbi:MAG: hypothetical protein QOG62_2203 [Thermoleophilaceae bacterium]|nr:hypothetical protein [Thermoleophilaceae bacterium]